MKYRSLIVLAASFFLPVASHADIIFDHLIVHSSVSDEYIRYYDFNYEADASDGPIINALGDDFHGLMGSSSIGIEMESDHILSLGTGSAESSPLYPLLNFTNTFSLAFHVTETTSYELDFLFSDTAHAFSSVSFVDTPGSTVSNQEFNQVDQGLLEDQIRSTTLESTGGFLGILVPGKTYSLFFTNSSHSVSPGSATSSIYFSVPEPSSGVLLLVGLCLFWIWGQYKMRNRG